jgi:hypothetical protein
VRLFGVEFILHNPCQAIRFVYRIWTHSDSLTFLLAVQADAAIRFMYRIWTHGDYSTDLLARSSGGITGCSSLKFLDIGRFRADGLWEFY